MILLLLCCAAAAAGLALPPVAPAWPPPAPSFPSSWFGGSLTGAEWQSPSQLAQLRQYKAVLTSWILPFGNFSNATAIASSQAVILKGLLGAGTAVFTYHSGSLAPAFYPEVAAIMADPATYGDFFLRSPSGAFLNSTTYCSQTNEDPATHPGCVAYRWNWCNASAVDYYVRIVLGGLVTDSAGRGLAYDGVFLDNSDDFSTDGAGNAACSAASASLGVHIATGRFFQTVGKWPVFSTTAGGSAMAAEAAALWAAGIGFSKFWESWNPSLGAVQQLYNETALGLPTVVHATVHGWPFSHKPPIPLADALAAFLVATGGASYTYFQYSTGWYDADWRWDPLFARQYGAAIGPPVITQYGSASDLGEVWVRAFTSGAVATLNCTPPSYKLVWCKGDITF
jgi:hypothetical protein